MSSSATPHRTTLASATVDVGDVDAAQFETPIDHNRARWPVWCAASVLGCVFTLLWAMALSGILSRAPAVEVVELQQLELSMLPQAEVPPPPVKPKQPPPPKSPAPKTREPPRPPEPLVAPSTNENPDFALPATEPPPEAAPAETEAASTPAVETPIPAAPIKVEPLFRLTRLPDISAIQDMENYPAAERNRGREGKVIAEIVIDEHGAVRDIKILKSAGALFDQAVIDHLSKLKLTPSYIGERPVAVRFPVEFKFILD